MTSRACLATILKLQLFGLCMLGIQPLPKAHSQEAARSSRDSIDPRWNEIQVIGSHNSYHIAPSPDMMKLIGTATKSTAESIDYTHPPIADQFQQQHVRQIELDIYADPEGGLYAQPIGRKLLLEAGLDAGKDPNLDGILDRPGLKILHAPGFDYATTVPTLKQALQQVHQWSSAHPRHVPILVLIELKESAPAPAMVKPIPFHKQQMDEVDREIRSVFSEDHLITPDSIRGNHTTLRDAVLQQGWPKLSACRGKVAFALDNEGAFRDRYLEGHEHLQGRTMFATVDAKHPAAAWMKINDPIAQYDHIQAMVRQGFLVRTRADANTTQSRRNDTTQREKALSSGAQFVSTDYAVPDRRFSEYTCRFPNGIVARNNPVVGAANRPDVDLEQLSNPQ